MQVLQDGHAELLRLQQRLLALLDAVARLLQLVVGAQQPVALRRARCRAARRVAWRALRRERFSGGRRHVNVSSASRCAPSSALDSSSSRAASTSMSAAEAFFTSPFSFVRLACVAHASARQAHAPQARARRAPSTSALARLVVAQLVQQRRLHPHWQATRLQVHATYLPRRAAARERAQCTHERARVPNPRLRLLSCNARAHQRLRLRDVIFGLGGFGFALLCRRRGTNASQPQ